MSPDIFFLFSLGVKMLVAALFVIGATVSTERAGPVVGGLIASLPISSGPAYIFLAFEHDAAFISTSTLASLAMNIGMGLCAFAFVLAAQRLRLWLCMLLAYAVWFGCAILVRQFEWSLLAAALANVVMFPALHFLARPFMEVRIPRMQVRFGDLILRALLVAALVAIVVTLSHRISASAIGIITVFPVVYSSLMILLYQRLGGHAAAAVVAHGFLGLVGFSAFLIVIHLTAVPLGAPLALTLGFATSVLWNLVLYAFSRRKALLEPI